MNADELIQALGLEPHPMEGGHFRETYRSKISLPRDALPAAYSGARSAGTAIYYLLTPQTFSEMHRLPGDEVFHFYLGGPVRMLHLDPLTGQGKIVILGSDLSRGHLPQVVVPGGVWQGCRLEPGSELALLGATMAPGFDYADYARGSRAYLAARFPDFAEWIEKLTRA